jgi:hypothetical protein
MTSYITSLEQYSRTTRKCWRRLLRRRPQFPPTSTATLFCRFTQVPYATIGKSEKQVSQTDSTANRSAIPKWLSGMPGSLLLSKLKSRFSKSSMYRRDDRPGPSRCSVRARQEIRVVELPRFTNGKKMETNYGWSRIIEPRLSLYGAQKCPRYPRLHPDRCLGL